MKENTAKKLKEMDLENKKEIQRMEEESQRRIIENERNMNFILNNFQKIINNNDYF